MQFCHFHSPSWDLPFSRGQRIVRETHAPFVPEVEPAPAKRQGVFPGRFPTAPVGFVPAHLPARLTVAQATLWLRHEIILCGRVRGRLGAMAPALGLNYTASSDWSLGLSAWPYTGPGNEADSWDWELTRKQQQFLESGTKGMVLAALERAGSRRRAPAHTLLDP